MLAVVNILAKNFIEQTSFLYLDNMKGNKAHRYFYFCFYFTDGAGLPLSDSE